MKCPHRPAAPFSVVLLCSCLAAGVLPAQPAPDLPPEDRAFLEDFGAALRRFRDLSLDEFLEESGPRKRYRDGGFVRGDANIDSGVDLSDAVCILGYLFTGGGACARPGCLDALDADDGGDLNITDAIYLLLYLYRGGPAPPEPFAEKGWDPTDADGLSCAIADDGGTLLDYDPLAAEYLDIILERFPLTREQEAVYRENGFVILEDQKFTSFLSGFGEIYFEDLPVYISADALMDALHLSFDRILMTVETELLIAELDSMLRRMDEGVDALRDHAGGADVEDELDDVAAWICTARSLLAGEQVACPRAVDEKVSELLSLVDSETMALVELFGSMWEEDFSQFLPRSHYNESEDLQRYFRAMMWVQRIGMNFLRYRRHAAVAYLLSRNLEDSGALENWSRIDAVIEAFVGVSDSLNPWGMIDLAEASAIGSVLDLYTDETFERFRQVAIEGGAGRQRINSQMLMADPYAEDFTPLSPAFHVMGQRFIVDSFVFTNVVYDRVDTWPRRFMPSPLDAWFVLGNRATVPLLEPEIATYSYHPHLAALAWIVEHYDETFWNANLYNVWLSCLRALSADTTGPPYPSVMQSVAWDRRMLHAQLASWSQLRHDTLLYAKPSYSTVPCEYPDGWVDPYPELYETLAAFAGRALERFEALELFDIPSGDTVRRYFESLASHSSALAGIARSELQGDPLSDDQTRFIRELLRRNVVEEGCMVLITFDGWYLDLIFPPWRLAGDQGLPALFEPTIADVHTDPMYGEVLHVGVGHPNAMLISVKTDCGTKAYAGPVFSYYEFTLGGLTRLTDGHWTERLRRGQEPAVPRWTAGFKR